MRGKLLLILLVTGLLLSSACTTRQEPTVLTKTIYQEVHIPVVHFLKRPSRPVFGTNETVPEYVNRIVLHAEILEVLIDENNKMATNLQEKNNSR